MELGARVAFFLITVRNNPNNQNHSEAREMSCFDHNTQFPPVGIVGVFRAIPLPFLFKGNRHVGMVNINTNRAFNSAKLIRAC